MPCHPNHMAARGSPLEPRVLFRVSLRFLTSPLLPPVSLSLPLPLSLSKHSICFSTLPPCTLFCPPSPSLTSWVFFCLHFVGLEALKNDATSGQQPPRYHLTRVRVFPINIYIFGWYASYVATSLSYCLRQIVETRRVLFISNGLKFRQKPCQGERQP